MNDSRTLFVSGSTSREDFERCVRAIKARMSAFQRGPLFFYSPTSATDESTAQQARLEQVRALEAELAGYDLPSDAAYLMRTSGSASGTGKIVLLSTASLVASAEATAQALGGAGRWTVCLPPAHIAGFQTIYRSLLAGTEPIWAGNGQPGDISEAVRAYRESERAYLSLVPVQLARLLEDAEATRAAQRYQAILVGGAACSAEVLNAAREAGLTIVQTYGMSETCGGCVYDGFPIGDTRVSVENDGRLVLSGSCVAVGYAGGEPFAGTFRTADCGSVDSQGKLSVFGRLDRAITSGGVTVIPEVVEQHVSECGCGETVVVGVDDATWGQAVVAVVENDVPNVRELLAQRLEKGWVPQRVVTLGKLGLNDFPRLPSGKPDRNTLTPLVVVRH
ncbi:MAG: AMP-binding protein [Actinomycetaceae bacterium]|nr:AMP-binding protein [Actinomycetaceae bacterium]